MTPSSNESDLQRAIRLENDPPSLAIVFMRVLKRVSGICLILSFIAFLLLFPLAAMEFLFLGGSPELYEGVFMVPFGIAFVALLIFVALRILSGWILDEAHFK